MKQYVWAKVQRYAQNPLQIYGVFLLLLAKEMESFLWQESRRQFFFKKTKITFTFTKCTLFNYISNRKHYESEFFTFIHFHFSVIIVLHRERCNRVWRHV